MGDPGIDAGTGMACVQPSRPHPPRWHRVFWAFALAILPITLLIVGGLRAVQSIVLVVSLPVLAIGVLMTVSLIRSLNADERG